jgi:sulfatase maturation enzyme AslB (radical SAM superfamily)
MKFPKKLLLGIQEGSCNLKCPKCYTHGENLVSNNFRSKGIMDFDKFISLLDEVKTFNPRIGPQTWDEPFLNNRIMNYLSEIKLRNLEVTIDTNGLLLSKADLVKLIDLEIDSVFISVDAFHAKTYKAVRGVDQLSKLENLIHEFIKIRGLNKLPRIGVSFVSEEENFLEIDLFVEKWSKVVDVIRINQKFLQGRSLKNRPVDSRTACWSLEDTLMIHHNGEAALCCVDTHNENKIGNVFDVGALAVWNGGYFNQVRADHEEGNFHKISICKSCDLWSHSKPQNLEIGNLLISKTLTHTYYNRIDKLDNITKNNRFI